MIHNISHGPAAELRRAYDALVELSVVDSRAICQILEELRSMYLQAFQAYTRGDMQNAEVLARAVRHLCRAAHFDAKIKYLESHAEDVPHVPGVNPEGIGAIDQRVAEIEARLARFRLTGIADRFGGRARKHLERARNLPIINSLLGDSFVRAAQEYCLATELLQQLETRAAA